MGVFTASLRQNIVCELSVEMQLVEAKMNYDKAMSHMQAIPEVGGDTGTQRQSETSPVTQLRFAKAGV